MTVEKQHFRKAFLVIPIVYNNAIIRTEQCGSICQGESLTAGNFGVQTVRERGGQGQLPIEASVDDEVYRERAVTSRKSELRSREAAMHLTNIHCAKIIVLIAAFPVPVPPGPNRLKLCR